MSNYTIHQRTNHGVYHKVGTSSNYRGAFNQLRTAAIKNRLSNYWISLDGCKNPISRLFQFDPDHDTLEDLEIIAND